MSVIDIGAIFRAELERARGELRENVRSIVSELLAAQAERLEPLHAILGCTRQAANVRMSRDPALKALGVRRHPDQVQAVGRDGLPGARRSNRPGQSAVLCPTMTTL